jgi:DNA replication protein DnaC
MNLSELARRFHFLSNLEALPEADRQILQRVLAEELHRREQKRLAYLMKCSGIKRVKLLTDFDWGFNPKLPREKFLQFVGTRWLTEPANLLLIGQAGVGKTHLATALCHDALTKGFQTLFLTLFELTAKIAKARNPYNLIEFYSRVPVLCIDELGYVIPSREQADALFQVISRRVEVNSTIVTTNLVPSQ